MAKLTKKDVLHIAKLAKLTLRKREVEKFTDQLSGIIDFISQLKEIDVTGVEPTSQTTGLEDVYREDITRPDRIFTQNQALSGTDKTHNGYFKVDAILTERTDK